MVYILTGYSDCILCNQSWTGQTTGQNLFRLLSFTNANFDQLFWPIPLQNVSTRIALMISKYYNNESCLSGHNILVLVEKQLRKISGELLELSKTELSVYLFATCLENVQHTILLSNILCTI